MEKSSELIDSLVPNISVSIEKYKNCSDVLGLALEKGISYLSIDSIDAALQIFHSIILYSDKERHPKIHARVYIELGLLHEYLGRNEDSRRNLDLAHSLILANSFHDIYPWYCVRNSSYHRVFGNRDTAMVYAIKATELGTKFGNDRASVDGLLLQGLLSSAIEDKVCYLEQTLTLYNKNEDYVAATSQCCNIARVLFEANQTDRGLTFLNRSRSYVNKIESRNSDYYFAYSVYYNMLTYYFRHSNQLDSAFHYQALKYDYEKKATVDIDHNKIDGKVNLFQSQLAAAQTKLTILTQVIFGLLTLLILGMGIALYLNNKKKNEIVSQKHSIELQNGQLEALNQKQAGLLTEVHHRVKNNLQLVISILTLSSRKIDDTEDFIDQISQKIRSMALIHNQLYATGDYEKINLEEYFISLKENYLTYSIFENKSVTINLNIDIINVNIETAMPLGLIITELLTNTLKHNKSMDGNLVIDIKAESIWNEYMLSYNDNGSGYSDGVLENLNDHMGVKLINNMVKQLDGTAQFFNNNGAKFIMNFKEKVVSKV